MNGVQVGIRCPRPDAAGAAFLHQTGSRSHYESLRRLAEARGWIEPATATRQTAASEHDIYAALELSWIPPELRNGDDEIGAARRGTLPPSSRASRSAAICTCTPTTATGATAWR